MEAIWLRKKKKTYSRLDLFNFGTPLFNKHKSTFTTSSDYQFADGNNTENVNGQKTFKTIENITNSLKSLNININEDAKNETEQQSAKSNQNEKLKDEQVPETNHNTSKPKKRVINATRTPTDIKKTQANNKSVSLPKYFGVYQWKQSIARQRRWKLEKKKQNRRINNGETFRPALWLWEMRSCRRNLDSIHFVREQPSKLTIINEKPIITETNDHQLCKVAPTASSPRIIKCPKKKKKSSKKTSKLDSTAAAIKSECSKNDSKQPSKLDSTTASIMGVKCSKKSSKQLSKPNSTAALAVKVKCQKKSSEQPSELIICNQEPIVADTIDHQSYKITTATSAITIKYPKKSCKYKVDKIFIASDMTEIDTYEINMLSSFKNKEYRLARKLPMINQQQKKIRRKSKRSHTKQMQKRNAKNILQDNSNSSKHILINKNVTSLKNTGNSINLTKAAVSRGTNIEKKKKKLQHLGLKDVDNNMNLTKHILPTGIIMGKQKKNNI